MVSWALQRRFSYGLVFLVLLTLIGGGTWYAFFYHTPTCTDGRQNGDETGVDCGGSCRALCAPDVLTPAVLWTKVFNVSGTVYTAAAYVENPNIGASDAQASYAFNIFDEHNVLLGSRTGQTFIPKNKRFVVFEPGWNLPKGIPKRVEFEFTSFSAWQKDDSVDPKLSINYSPLLSTSTIPRIEGTIANNSLSDIPRIELVAVVSDGKENTVAVSRTFVDSLRKGTDQQFVFTWPKPFDLGVESCEKPLDVAVVLDRSTSMRSEQISPPEPFTTVKVVATDFVQNLLGDDQISIISFGTSALVESPLSSDISSAVGAIGRLSLSTTTEQTNIADGLKFALQAITGGSARKDANRAVVLLTDGVPTEPRAAGQPQYPQILAESVAKDILTQGITLYTIGLGNAVNEKFLKGIASDQDHYFFAPTKETLSGIYSRISNSLCIRKPNAIRIIYRIPSNP